MVDVKKRVLGKSGIEVSPLGLGCMGAHSCKRRRDGYARCRPRDS